MKQMSFCVNVRDGARSERFELDSPAMGHEVLAMSSLHDRANVMAWRVSRILRPMGWFIEDDHDVEFVDTSSPAGAEIYRNTLAFIMALSCRRATGSDVVVKHSMNGARYCELESGPATAQQVEDIKREMQKIVDSAMPIQMATLSIDKARRIFERQGNYDRADLVHWIGTDPIMLSRCLSCYAYFGSPLAPNTGAVKTFDLQLYEPGFMLRFPDMSKGVADVLVPLEVERKLMDVFNEYSQWLKVLGLTTMASLHERVASGKALDVVMVSEALHSMSLAQIASKIADRGGVKLICLAGPSSSGKTTTSKRLSIQLQVLGKRPVTVELDNFYMDRELCPRDEDGRYDFEALEALDVELINDSIERLIAGEEVELPKYDFITGSRKRGRTLKLGPDDVLIIEGIHGLNDAITRNVSHDEKFKIFICPLTGVNLDTYNRIGTTDTRLLRRIVRDHRTRGHSPEHTIRMWPSVIRGSHKYIFPYEKEADALFNTALTYEIPVLKGYAEPLLRSIPETSPEYGEARRLMSLLSFAPLIPSDSIPNTSIIREFIGGSCFEG